MGLRGGAATLVTALDVISAEVISAEVTTTEVTTEEVTTADVITRCKPRHRHTELLGVRHQIEAWVPGELDIPTDTAWPALPPGSLCHLTRSAS